jgi:hypothetical protein
MEITPSGMETTLSTVPIEGNDLMDPSFPTLTIHPANIDLGTMAFPFDDEQSASIWIFRKQFRNPTALDTGLHETHVAEEPTTVEPLATLIADENSSDSTTCPSLADDSASEREDSVPSQYTPPTPVCNSPSLEPAPVMSPAPADVNSQVQPQIPGDLTPEMIETIAQYLHNEWMRLHPFANTANSLPAQMIERIPAQERTPPVSVFYHMHFHGYTAAPGPRESGQVYPFFSSMGHHMLPTFPMPPQALQTPPVSNKRTFEFIEPEIPENFVANPNNHGRWQYDRNGNRHYLNAPKTKRPRTN